MKKILKQAVLTVLMCLLAIAIAGQEPINSGKININTADINQLSQLKRVGTSYAVRIVEYREKNGAFQAPEDIMKVKGIGQKTFDDNKDTIIVAEEKPVKSK
jgi:competence protein ComEA